MLKVLSIVTVIVAGMLVLGGCGSPAARPSQAQSPALSTAEVNAPVSVPAPAPDTAAATPIGTAPVPTPAPAPVTAPVSAALTYSNLKITPLGTKDAKVTGTVTVKVTNNGGPGTFPVTLEFLGDNDECPMLASIIKDVTLAGSTSADVDFPVSLDAEFAARFTLKIGQLKGNLVK